MPSGLFPAGPPRPTYREPHPVRLGSIVGGASVAAAWLLLVGLVAASVNGYLGMIAGACALAWAGAGVLAVRGDRGAATGAAVAIGVAIAVTFGLFLARWITVGWPFG